MPCDKLSTIKLPNNKQKKYFLIIHVPSRSKSNNFLGHWLGCCINTQTKQCLLVDSANVVPSQTGTMHYISNFCNANRLTLLNFNLMFQDKSNVLCGQYQLYICSIFSKRSLRQTLNLKYMLQKYNLKKLAYFIIQQVERHFHIKFWYTSISKYSIYSMPMADTRCYLIGISVVFLAILLTFIIKISTNDFLAIKNHNINNANNSTICSGLYWHVLARQRHKDRNFIKRLVFAWEHQCD